MAPNQIINLLQLAAAHHKAGRLAEASRLYAQVRAAAPSLAEAWQLGGLAAQQQGRAQEAATLLAQAHRLQPKNADFAAQLGAAHAAAGHPTEAEKALLAAISLKPDHPEALANLGFVCQLLNRIADSKAWYDKLTQVHPKRVEGWNGLGTSLALLGRFSEAVDAFQTALSLAPSNISALFGRGRSYLQSHCVPEALRDFDAILARQPNHIDVINDRLFALNYLDSMSREELFTEHLRFGHLVETPAILAAHAKIRWPKPSDPERSLRVGFLSCDLRRHSVAYFTLPLLVHLDRSRFEVVLYHDHFVEDAVSEQLKQHATLWRNFVGQSGDMIERTIRSDAIDVLIDLAGHTGLNRLPLYARRLAPVQATYLGYPNTTGLRTMDYRLSDPIADPPGDADPFCTERLLRFSSTAWSYTPSADAPPVAPTPCLASGQVTFGSFNALSKVNAFTLSLWRRILERVPGARLLLKSYQTPGDTWTRKLAEAGIDPARVTMLQQVPSVAGHLACYGQLDIALDPHPYNGTTTTCEAMWMGVPVITLAGDRHSSRVGASLLTSVGHPEWIASSADNYVERAVALASDAGALSLVRSTLRRDMLRSALLDQPAQGRRFGEAIRTMWRETCARLQSRP